jgi:hypothetical protein
MKKNSAPAAIEGSKIQLKGQDIKPSGFPTKIKENIMFPVQAYKQATGTIIEEINPKICRFRQYSMLNENDEISGKILWGLSSYPLKKPTIGNLGRTGKHPGQDLILNGNFCYLEIIQGWKGLPLLQHPRNELKQIFLPGIPQ